MSFYVSFGVRKTMVPAPKFSPQEQEEMILNAAADCIWETSILDFTMSAVSKAAGLSMGSIYKHVQCKEDIILALGMRSFACLAGVFEQVLSLDITTPEKIVGIGLLSKEKTQVYPFDSQLMAMATNEAVIKRASPYWTERLVRSSESCEAMFNKWMHKAAFSGELILNGNTEAHIQEFCLGTWALTVGFDEVQTMKQIQQVSDGQDTLKQAPALDSPMIKNLHRLINTYDWQQPLTNEGIVTVSERLIELNFR